MDTHELHLAPRSSYRVLAGSSWVAASLVILCAHLHREDSRIMAFPVDLSQYTLPQLDPWHEKALPAPSRDQLLANVQLCRDAIVSFTACGAASGCGGHTGGAFDVVPEVCFIIASAC